MGTQRTLKMRIAIILASTVTASPLSSTSNHEIVVPTVKRIDSSHERTCRSFEASIRRLEHRDTWTKRPRQALYQKSNCPGPVTYDANFCTLVCQLAEGDQCQPNPSFGDEICDPFFDLYDESSSSSEFLDDLFKPLYDEPMKQ